MHKFFSSHFLFIYLYYFSITEGAASLLAAHCPPNLVVACQIGCSTDKHCVIFFIQVFISNSTKKKKKEEE